MSKNASYLKSNYPSHSPINIHQRQKNMSMSPHDNRVQRKTAIQTLLKNQMLPSTEAKRQRQNDEDYIDYMAPRVSIYQQKTNKKSLYQKPSPLKPSSTNYANTQHNNLYPSVTGGKAEILKEQNMFLTQQNTHLNELLAEKSKIILTLEKKLQYQVQQEVITLEQIEREKNKFLADFHQRDDEQRIQIQKLLIQLQLANDQLHHSNEQISKLNIEMQEIIRSKDQEIKAVKTAYGEENKHIVQNIIGNKDIEIATLQNKLAEVISTLEQATLELKSNQQSFKATQDHLNQQIKRLMEEIEQVNHQRKIQLSQQKIAYDNLILTLSKEKQQEISNTVFKCDVQLKRYKNLLNQQVLTNTHLQRQLESLKLDHSNETQHHLNSQNQLKHEIYEIQNFYQQKHHNEMQKQKQINGKQTRMIQQTIQIKDKQYEQEMNKLIGVNRQQRAEIQRLLEEIEILRREKREEIERVEKVNLQLRQKIADISQSTEQQSQTLKVKLGQLRHTDITSLKQYYQNQLKLKSQEIMDLQKIVKQNRDKLHQELEDKVLQRKLNQKLVDDLRIKIGQLELRMAMMTEQHKEKLHSMGSQIQMTSMTLIRQTAQKQKYSQQSQIEKRNLQQIITTKDQEIEELNNKITLIKKSHSQQVEEKVQTITILQEKTSQLNEEIKRQREFYQKEIQKKEQIRKQTKEFYEQEIQKQKDTYSREFSEVTERLMKQKNQLNVQLEHLIIVEKQLREQLALHAQHHEQRTMEQDVARNEERSRLQYAKQTSEIGLKNYYEKRITDIQQELNITKQQLSEKAQDVRNLTDKNYKLEKKIQKIIESQQKMRVLQEKVMALGQENNLVKNVAQLSGTKSRRKAV